MSVEPPQLQVSWTGESNPQDSLAEQQQQQQQQLPLDSAEIRRRCTIGMNASWAVNIALLFAKAAAFGVSLSYSVLASLIDSVVDLLSQVLVALAERYSRRWHPDYPTGRSRLEPMAVVGCACIMSVATVLVIRESADALAKGFGGELPELNVGAVLYSIIGVSTLLKLGLWLYCRSLRQYSPAMLALAEDHWNDILSNLAAIITPTIAFYVPKVWWLDPAGGIVISLYILFSWYMIFKEQMEHIVGIKAPDGFVDEVTALVQGHNGSMVLDRILAYHFGHRYMVEIEVVMEEDTPLKVSHDVAMELQHKVEALDNVERAYVHVDYERRDYLEHKVERTLLLKADSLPGPSSPQAAAEEGLAASSGLRHRDVGAAAASASASASAMSQSSVAFNMVGSSSHGQHVPTVMVQ